MDFFEPYGSWLIITTMVIAPVWLGWRTIRPDTSGRLSYYFLSLILISLILSVSIAYWPHLYKDLKLTALGADLGALTDVEAVSTVSPENQAEAYRLYHSLRSVGWPVSATAWFTVFFMPYSLVCWLVFVAIKWIGNLKRA